MDVHFSVIHVEAAQSNKKDNMKNIIGKLPYRLQRKYMQQIPNFLLRTSDNSLDLRIEDGPHPSPLFQ